MLSREEFIFTIGYDGPAAVVDRQAKRRFGSLSARQLAEQGMFRAAYAAAVWSKDPADTRAVTDIYNGTAFAALGQDAALERLFGVFPVDAKRSITL